MITITGTRGNFVSALAGRAATWEFQRTVPRAQFGKVRRESSGKFNFLEVLVIRERISPHG